MLFEVFRSEDSNTIDSIALGQFVVALENSGLRRSDPRLAEMLAKVNIYAENTTGVEVMAGNLNKVDYVLEDL